MTLQKVAKATLITVGIHAAGVAAAIGLCCTSPQSFSLC